MDKSLSLLRRLSKAPQSGIIAAVESFCNDINRATCRVSGVRWYSVTGTEPGGQEARDAAGRKTSTRQRPSRSRRYEDRYGSSESSREYGEDHKDDGKMKTIHRVTPMSKDLLSLYEAVKKGDKNALARYTKTKDEPMDDADMVLLADAIEFYFALAPSPSSNVGGFRQGERTSLAALAKIIRAYKGSEGRDAATPKDIPISSPLEKKVVNTAPPGRIPWLVMGANDELGAIYWGVDLTGGKAKDPWSNAKLSQAAKTLMYDLHVSDPDTYTVERLSEVFCIRKQRVMAILHLKELEKQQDTTEDSLGDETAEVMERALKCHAGIGSNEKHHTTLPSFPAYARLEKEKVIPALENVLGKKIEDIEPEDITPDVAKQVFGTKTLEEIEDIVAAREEEHLVEEFKQRLEFNIGITGKTISRDSRRTKAPRRPKEGWNLVVTPIGKESKLKHTCYVAMPDGSQREPNEDEMLYMERKRPRPRRRIL